MDAILDTAYEIFLAGSRLLLPFIVILLLINWLKHYRGTVYYRHVIAALKTEDNVRIPVTSFESSIGRSDINEIVIPYSGVSKTHAVLTRSDRGFRISRTGENGSVYINDEEIYEPTDLEFGDIIGINDEKLELCPPVKSDYGLLPKRRQHYFAPKTETFLMTLLTLFQILTGLQLCFRAMPEVSVILPVCFIGMIILEWVYYSFSRRRTNSRLLIEVPALFLITLGFSVCASRGDSDLKKQALAVTVGIIAYVIVTYLLCNIELTMRLRYFAAGAAVLLLGANIILGSGNGAKNWINLGFTTIQPSEFVKPLFIFAGSATLERLLTARNFGRFLTFSAVCMLPLVYIRDFGALAIFFVTMMIIIIMRLGDPKIVTALCALVVIGGIVVLLCVPYVSNRFSSWRHVWDDPANTGYQQTRAMIAAASGGLFGVGGHNGYLSKVAAADTDLVFGVLSEEWGLIIALSALAVFILLALYAVRLARSAQSAYYSIGVCAAAGQMLFQVALNVFGALDILPLTGVTMPFVSNGGSSILASFCLLAFFKAAEIKQIYTVDVE